MKKIIISLIITLGILTMACDLNYVPVITTVDAREIKIGNIYDYSFKGSEEIPGFENIEDAVAYISDNTISVSDKNLYHKDEYWETPEEFFNSKYIEYFNYSTHKNNMFKADCDGYSNGLAYILYFRMNFKDTKFVVTQLLNKEYHVIVYADTKYIDITVNQIYSNLNEFLNKSKEKFIEEIPYTEALWMTINYHRTVGKY